VNLAKKITIDNGGYIKLCVIIAATALSRDYFGCTKKSVTDGRDKRLNFRVALRFLDSMYFSDAGSLGRSE